MAKQETQLNSSAEEDSCLGLSARILHCIPCVKLVRMNRGGKSMSATLLLEKKVFVVDEAEISKVIKSSKETCTCGLLHMSTHNAVCQACSQKK